MKKKQKKEVLSRERNSLESTSLNNTKKVVVNIAENAELVKERNPKWVYYNDSGVERIEHNLFAKEFLEEHTVLFQETEGGRKFYIFTECRGWEEKRSVALSRLIHKKLGHRSTRHHRDEIRSALLVESPFIRDDEEFDNLPKNLIPMQNGLYDWTTDTLLPFQKDYRHLYKMDIPYVKGAKAERWTRFVEYITHSSGMEAYDCIHEFFGYTFYRDVPFAKWLMLVGRGGNGKSTLLETLRGLLGAKNTASVRLKTLGESEFALSRLIGKHANIVGEDTSKALKDSTNLKAITGGDTLSIDIKNKEATEQKLHAKVLMALNFWPEIYDTTEGFGRRPLTIELNTPVEAFFLSELKQGEQQIDFVDEEGPGIFNLAMEGLRRVMERGGQSPFSESLSMESAKREWLYDNNVVKQFLDEHTEPTKQILPQKLSDFTEIFNEIMRENYSTRDVKGKLLDLGVKVTAPKTQIGNVRSSHVLGIKIIAKLHWWDKIKI